MDKYLKIRKISALYILIALVPITLCVEEPEREVFLPPRNFNPHPYQAGAKTDSTGPVTFPSNEGDDAGNTSNVVTIGRTKTAQPIDNNPYLKVAKKNRFRLAGKYHNQEHSVNPNILQALAIHAGRVLTRPPEKLKDDYRPTQIENQNLDYAFAYKVVDQLTGDDFSHRQSQSSKATKGEYRVKLPDGRVQIVSYTADKNGYNAEVKYTEEHNQAAVQIQKAPVTKLAPATHKLYDLYNYLQPKPEPVVYVTQAPPTDDYINYVTPQPGDIYIPQTYVPKPKVPNVQIITTNARDYNTGSYIPVTVSPLYINPNDHLANLVSTTPAPAYDVGSSFVSTTISPLVVNNGNHGHIVPKTRHDYQTQNDDVFLLTTVAPSTVAPKDILVNGARYTLLKSHDLHLQFKKK